MKSGLIALSFLCAALAWAEEVPVKETTFGDSLTTISRLEAAGKWEEALPIYKRWHEKLSLAFDGLSVGFVLRKGICELHCNKLDDAEKSFSWIVEFSKAPHEKVDKTRAMFYLAETMGRNGKPDGSRKALDDAIRYFDQMDDVAHDPGWIAWRKRMATRIIEINANTGTPKH